MMISSPSSATTLKANRIASEPPLVISTSAGSSLMS
jgi:hypothetical protein